MRGEQHQQELTDIQLPFKEQNSSESFQLRRPTGPAPIT